MFLTGLINVPDDYLLIVMNYCFSFTANNLTFGINFKTQKSFFCSKVSKCMMFPKSTCNWLKNFHLSTDLKDLDSDFCND